MVRRGKVNKWWDGVIDGWVMHEWVIEGWMIDIWVMDGWVYDV